MGNAVIAKRFEESDSIVATLVPRTNVASLHAVKKKILFVSPELADLIKVGGLGDVSASLPRALSNDHDVRVLIPGYRQVLESGYPIKLVGQVPGHAALPPCRIGCMTLPDGLIVYVLLSADLYDRDGTPYGDSLGRDWPDNHIRFARLGLAAAEIASGTACINWCPELVHANDWPAALTPAYMSWRGVSTPSVFTIHNLAYQGLCGLECSPELGLPSSACSTEGMEFYGKLSFLKAGLVYSDHVTTVSANYAREITTEEFGCGLEGMLQFKVRLNQLSGIPNGIDDSWDPLTDPHLVQGFDAFDLDARRANTRHVEQMFDLEPGDGPLFAVVSRLVQQKGIDLTLEVADYIVARGGRIAMIGRGEEHLEEAVRELGRRHPGRVGVNVGFNEADARCMFAGSDFLLMPSRFEPCGLSQMYAQCFGSLPIARATGGLTDTIEDGGTGFLFPEANAQSYREAIDRALAIFGTPELLNAMRSRAMANPLYWRQSVQPYAALYRSLMAAHQVRGILA